MAQTPVPSDTGEPAVAAPVDVARRLRRRTDSLGLTQGELSERSGVGRTVVNQVLSGRRLPSVRTYTKLCAALGLDADPADLAARRLPIGLPADRVAALCAALLVTRHVALADVASALDISIAAIRENLDAAAARLVEVGFTLTDDGTAVRLWPLEPVAGVVATLTDTELVETPSAEQLEILAVVAYFGGATRARIERYRGEDCTSLLDRLVRRGLLAKVRDDAVAGAPNVYRVTGKALRAAGFATVEAMRATVAAVVTAAEQSRLLADCLGGATDGAAGDAADPQTV